MGRGNATLLVLAALVLAAGSAPEAGAQSRRWRDIRGRALTRFDWNCASPSAYPRAGLKGVLRGVLRRSYAGDNVQADRAFAFDLTGDRKPEYFIPLVCGATGNCDWGVFAMNPARFLGTVNGQYVYVHARAGRWPDIVTYGHATAAEGTLGTYVFRRGRYAWAGDVYGVGDEGRDSDIPPHGPLRRMPGLFERARPACEGLGG